jgi:hypothetical protein
MEWENRYVAAEIHERLGSNVEEEICDSIVDAR